MGGDSSHRLSSFKKEWSLFWEGLFEDRPDIEIEEGTPKRFAKIETLSIEDIKEISKSLSADRKNLNQKLEHLNRELELNSAKLESLRLVGSDESDTLKRISDLSDQGLKLTQDLNKINHQLDWIRDQESLLLEGEDEL